MLGIVALNAPLVRAGGHLWPYKANEYPNINRLQLADGVVTYKVDLSGLLNSRHVLYTREDVQILEEAASAAFDAWNEALAPIGLQFKRVGKLDTAELPVFAVDYSLILPDALFGDTVAGALNLPAGKVISVLPIVLDNAEHFEDLRFMPTIIGPTLHQPYVEYNAPTGVDTYSVLLHEIGHELGLGHPSEVLRGNRNYNFLALDTVSVDADCLKTSNFFSGEDIAKRRPLLRTEVDSVMAPIRLGGVMTEIPPDDLAFVAFAFRDLDPDGADEMLHRAQARFAETNPLRFANVISEVEEDTYINNDRFERAMPITIGQIVIGSLALGLDEADSKDIDFFQFEVGPEEIGQPFYFDIDGGGGLDGVSWVNAILEIFNAQRVVVAFSDDSDELDEGSISTEDPFLIWTPEVEGTYYIRLSSAPPIPENGSIGDYTLKTGVGGVSEPSGEADFVTDTSVEGCPKVVLNPLKLPATCGSQGLVGASLFSLLTLFGAALRPRNGGF